MTALTVAGNVADDYLGVGLEDGGIVDAPPAIGPRLGGLHPDVRTGDELEEELLAPCLAEVQRDMEHVAPLLHPRAGRLDTVGAFQRELQVAPHKVTLAGPLYLDDLCAHFGGEEGGEGLSNDGAAGQDLDALKRAESLGH